MCSDTRCCGVRGAEKGGAEVKKTCVGREGGQRKFWKPMVVFFFFFFNFGGKCYESESSLISCCSQVKVRFKVHIYEWGENERQPGGWGGWLVFVTMATWHNRSSYKHISPCRPYMVACSCENGLQWSAGWLTDARSSLEPWVRRSTAIFTSENVPPQGCFSSSTSSKCSQSSTDCCASRCFHTRRPSSASARRRGNEESFNFLFDLDERCLSSARSQYSFFSCVAACFSSTFQSTVCSIFNQGQLYYVYYAITIRRTSQGRWDGGCTVMYDDLWEKKPTMISFTSTEKENRLLHHCVSLWCMWWFVEGRFFLEQRNEDGRKMTNICVYLLDVKEVCVCRVLRKTVMLLLTVDQLEVCVNAHTLPA